MASFKADIVEINPAENGTRKIDAEPSTGKMRLFDPSAPNGISLEKTAGVAVDDIYIVAPGGTGAAYNTIENAMDAVRTSSGSSHLIMVFPGVYAEANTILIDRENLVIKAMGPVTVQHAGGTQSVFSISAGTDTPTRVTIEGLRIISAGAGVAGVSITGGNGSTLGSNGINLKDCQWVTSGTSVALSAITANHIKMIGGSMKECAGGGSKISIDTCASFSMDGVLDGKSVNLSYTDAGNEPVDSGTPIYRVLSSGVSAVTAAFTNKGTLDVIGCTGNFPVTLTGTQSARFIGSYIGDAEIRNTSQALFSGSSYTSMTNDLGVTIIEPILTGTDSLGSGDTTTTVTLPYTQPDTDYVVSVSMSNAPLVACGVTTKGTSSFIAEFASSDVAVRNFDWALTRIVKV